MSFSTLHEYAPQSVQEAAVKIYQTAEPLVKGAVEKVCQIFNRVLQVQPFVPQVVQNATSFAAKTSVSAVQLGDRVGGQVLDTTIATSKATADFASKAVHGYVDLNVKVAKGAYSIASSTVTTAKNVTTSAATSAYNLVEPYVSGKKDAAPAAK